jgi:hypothetical protein
MAQEKSETQNDGQLSPEQLAENREAAGRALEEGEETPVQKVTPQPTGKRTED